MAPMGTREQLLDQIPVGERRLELAGIPTALLEGGDGPPIVLLHGPGEFAAKWMRVIPELVGSHRVIAPDLPGHGDTEAPEGSLEPERVLDWLDELIEATCSSPPTLVGHVLGGSIAARFAAEQRGPINRLVLVDSLGLGRFRPKPGFALTLIGFNVRPSERSYERFMRQCSTDLDGLREQMGRQWEPFSSYSLEMARSPRSKAVGRLMRNLGVPRIPEAELERIQVPTTLIWGRQDRANRLGIAEAAVARYGWGLEVIEDCADDPARDRPEAFLRALESALSAPSA